MEGQIKIWKPLLFLCGFAAILFLNFYINTDTKNDTTFKIPPPRSKHTTAKPHQQPNRTIILIWSWPFGRPANIDLNTCSSEFQIDNCYLTDDHAFYNKADGVIINHNSVKSLSYLPPQPRPHFQKWVWMHFESPQNTRKTPGLESLFNATMNYRRDADISVHEQMIPKTDNSTDEIFPAVLQKKDKLVCWIVSNWNTNHDRVKYYKQLREKLKERNQVVTTYGRAFQKQLNREQYDDVMRTCKFYLSFENTKNCIDYVTEKLYNPLTKGSVPVVLGPPRHIYEKFVSPDSFIHVDDFPTAEKMADYLVMLDKNEEEYKKYFRWRTENKIKLVNYPLEHLCRACEYIQTKKDVQIIPDLYQWYWDNRNFQ